MSWRRMCVAVGLALGGCGGAAAEPPQVLYSACDITVADDVWVDESHVYWVTLIEDLLRVPKDGGDAVSIPHPGASCDDMAFDDQRIYCVGLYFPATLPFPAGRVTSFPKDGGEATELYFDPRIDNSQLQPLSIAVDGEYVYWGNYEGSAQQPYENGQLLRVPKTGGDAEVLAEGLISGVDIAVDEDHVYWSDRDGSFVARVPKIGGEVEALATGFYEPRSIALDAEFVYVAVPGTREMSRADGSVWRLRKQGPATWELVAADQAFPWGIAADANGVVWLASGEDPGIRKGGSIVSLPTGMSDPETLADGIELGWSMTIDSTHAYWTNYDGCVFRVPR